MSSATMCGNRERRRHKTALSLPALKDGVPGHWVNQLNVMLIAQPKPAEDEAPRRIGFRLARALEGENASDSANPQDEA